MKTSVKGYDTIALGLLKKEEEEERRRIPNRDFLLRAVRTSNCAIYRCYTLIRLEIS